MNSKISVLEYFAKDVLSLDPFTAELRCMFEGCAFRRKMRSSLLRRAASLIPARALTRHVGSRHRSV